jgi:PAS domain S-box-containing protein
MGTRDDDVPHEQDDRESLRRRIAELESKCARLTAGEQELATIRGHSDQLEARLRALYDESPLPIGFSRQGLCLAANPAYLKLLGFESTEEFLGRSVLETIAPSARAEIERRIKARESGQPVEDHYETRGLRKDGSEFPCEIHVTRIELADGPISAYFVEDVSKRMQAEAALAQSEARFRGLVEGSRDATAVVDPNGKVIYTSPNAAKLTGYPLGARDGKSILDTIHPEDQPSALSALRRLLGEGPGRTATLEFRGIREDGSVWWGEANATNMVSDPNIGGVVVNYRDITERKGAIDALRESEARFRDVAHAHAGIVWEVNEQLTLTHVSGRVREILGYEPDEMRGRPFTAFLDSEEADRIHAALATALKGSGSVRDLESWYQHKDGRRVRLSSSAVAFFSSTGEFLGIRGTHLDITELHWSRERRELLLKLHRMSGETDSAISAFLCQACASQTESPLSFFGMVEPDGSAMVAHVWSPSAQAGCQVEDKPRRLPIAAAGLWADPIRLHRPVIVNDFSIPPTRRGLPDGHVTITRYLGVPILKDGKAIAITGVANKVTPYDDEDLERIQVLASGISAFLASRSAERAARQSDARLRTFIDFTADWEYWRQPDGRHEYDSPACERITGHTAQEFIADPDLVARVVHPDDRAAFDEHVASAHMQGPQAREIEFRILHRNGEVRWIQHDCRPVSENGQFAGTRVSNRDITRQKLADEERLQMQEQLHHAQKMEAIGTLAGGIAHDFNNILGGVLGGLSLLEMELGHTDRQADIDDMKELVRRGADLARQLLGFSRRGKYHVQPLDVREVVSKTATMFGRTHREIVIEQTFGADLQAALMDHVQLEQVLLNLFLNAAHAMPGGGWLLLQASHAELGQAEAKAHGITAGRFVKMVVTDSGTGIDPATLPRIFEPFFTTKAPGQGSGLGLASVYGIIKNHGGAITVESELGRGTAFTILVPATNVPAAEKPRQRVSIRPGQGTVLVVDDEEPLLHLCSRLLEAMGYRVLAAPGGRAAVDLMRKHEDEISLVILDLTMPEMSGAKTFEALREISPTVKVLLASGASEDGQAQQLLDRGCNGFLQKPFDAVALSEKIRSLR